MKRLTFILVIVGLIFYSEYGYNGLFRSALIMR